jgi:hypothetical protein
MEESVQYIIEHATKNKGALYNPFEITDDLICGKNTLFKEQYLEIAGNVDAIEAFKSGDLKNDGALDPDKMTEYIISTFKGTIGETMINVSLITNKLFYMFKEGGIFLHELDGGELVVLVENDKFDYLPNMLYLDKISMGILSVTTNGKPTVSVGDMYLHLRVPIREDLKDLEVPGNNEKCIIMSIFEFD